MEIYV